MRIRCLLDKDHQIGHSYFIGVENDLDIFNVLLKCVIPLLEEYFYDDVNKIRQILKDNDKKDSEYNFYIEDSEAQEALKSMPDYFDDDKKIYMLNPKLSDANDEQKATWFVNHILGIPNEQ